LPSDRGGILPLPVVEAVIDDLGEGLERIDLFNYGEPFLYPHLVDALRHVRRRCPEATVNLSTNGIPITEETEEPIIAEGLADWILFSLDGVDADTYTFYRAGGSFTTAWEHLLRFHSKARSSGVHVVWQYLVFRWNDTNRELQTAVELADRHGLTLWFEFVRTWGCSKRGEKDLAWLQPFLKPGTSLPAS